MLQLIEFAALSMGLGPDREGGRRGHYQADRMMPKAQSRRWHARVLGAALLVAAAATLSGCSSAGLVDHIPTAVGGLPEGAPERPTTQPAYPAVHDMPPARNATVLSDAEKKRLKEELTATRERIAKDNAANQAGDDAFMATGSAGRAPNP
jgi:hypothetical protein